MKIRGAALFTIAVIALSGAVRADDIVYFTNGTAMPVRSHKIEKGMIRVDLGSNASMAFPVSMVERVESAGRNVFGTGGTQSNQAVAGTPNAPNTTATAHASIPPQYRQGRRDDPMDQLAQAQARAKAQAEGGQLGSPAGTNTSAKRNLRVIAGGTPVVNEDGTFKRGDVTVIPSPRTPPGMPGNDSRPAITTFGPPNPQPEPVPDENANSGDGDDGGGDPDADDPPDQR